MTDAPGRRLLSRLPLWARVSGITALILVGVFASSMLLGASGVGGGNGGSHGGQGQMQTPHQGGSGSSHSPGGSHSSGGGR